MEKVYVVVMEEDPGYAPAKVLGVFTSKERAELRRQEYAHVYDIFTIEAPLNENIEATV